MGKILIKCWYRAKLYSHGPYFSFWMFFRIRRIRSCNSKANFMVTKVNWASLSFYAKIKVDIFKVMITLKTTILTVMKHVIFANYVILRLVHNVQNVQNNALMEFLIAKQLARLAKTNAAYWLPDTLMELLIDFPESQLNLFRKWNEIPTSLIVK